MFGGTAPGTSYVVTTSDLSSFKRQESIFIILNLLLLAFILALHTVFASFGASCPRVVGSSRSGVSGLLRKTGLGRGAESPTQHTRDQRDCLDINRDEHVARYAVNGAD